MAKLFGTDGVRGLANGVLTAELALDLSVSAAHVLAERMAPSKTASRRKRKPASETLRLGGVIAKGPAAVDAGELAIEGSDVDEDVDVGDTPSAIDDPLIGDQDEEDWPPERVERKLLRQLHAAIVAHVASGDLVPSLELEIAMDNARAALDSLWG